MPRREGLKDSLGKGLTTKDKDSEGDSNTEFPTAEAIRNQLFLRLLGSEDGLNLPVFKYLADKIAELFWSYKRKSREEIVRALIGVQMQDMIETGMQPLRYEMKSVDSGSNEQS